jgi:hypothetical protein
MRWLRVACTIVATATFWLAPAAIAAQATAERGGVSHVWLDQAGQPLPFQTQAEILEFLRSAEVVDRSPIGEGTTGAERLVLERDGVRARAAFRKVDKKHSGPFEGFPMYVRRLRDAAVFECAAYELSQALGLERVPPTVARTIDKTSGSVQIWLEGALTQPDFLKQSKEPPDAAVWNLQKYRMYVFDALVANLDRNQGNILVGRQGTLWLIDHTRSFAEVNELLDYPKKITRCSRDLWLALRNMDEAALEQRLAPFLTKGEIKSLFKRRQALVAHIERLIAKSGEPTVLFDIGS